MRCAGQRQQWVRTFRNCACACSVRRRSVSGSDNEERRTFKRCLLTAVTRAPRPPPPGAGGGRFEAAAAAAAPDVRDRLLGRVVGVAAAAGPPKSIVHNGNVYKSLAGHDPHLEQPSTSTTSCTTCTLPGKSARRRPMHVCANYPWASYANGIYKISCESSVRIISQRVNA